MAGTETKWDQPWDRNKTGIEIEWDSHRKKAKQKWFQHCLEKETQWEKNWLLYNCLHTFCASAYTHLKIKHFSYFANTFTIRLYVWIYHIVIQNLKLSFMSSYVHFCTKLWSNWLRDVKQIMVSMQAILKPNYLFFTVSICGCEYSITIKRKVNTSTMCSCTETKHDFENGDYSKSYSKAYSKKPWWLLVLNNAQVIS